MQLHGLLSDYPNDSSYTIAFQSYAVMRTATYPQELPCRYAFQSYAVTQTASLRRENVRKGLPISIFRSHADCFYAIRTNVQALYCFQSYAAVWAASRGEADTPRSHFNLMQSYRLLRQ